MQKSNFKAIISSVQRDQGFRLWKGGLLFKMKNEYDLFKKINYYVKNKKSCKIDQLWSQRLDRFDFETNMKKYVNVIDG